MIKTCVYCAQREIVRVKQNETLENKRMFKYADRIL